MTRSVRALAPARPPGAARGWWGRAVYAWRGLALAGALALVLLVVGARLLTTPAAAPANPTPPPEPARLTARGQVQPIRQARVGTLVGGVVQSIAVQDGQPVRDQQELARVRGPGGLEVLVAPLDGVVTGVLVHAGDTVVPGTVVATVGDLRQLQVETTDVDEFLVGRVQPGQAVSMTVEALDRRELAGRVRTVALEPRPNPSGDPHYPVVIDLLGALPPELRPGMTVRLTFAD